MQLNHPWQNKEYSRLRPAREGKTDAFDSLQQSKSQVYRDRQNTP